MRILFVLENYYPHIGGVETVFENLAKGLSKKGHEVNVVTSRLDGTSKFESKDGYKIHRVSVPLIGRRYWFSFFGILKVMKLAKNADIIHTTTYNGALPARIAAKLLGKPSVITVHEVLGRSWKTSIGMNGFSAKLHQILERIIVGLKFDCFVAVSKSTEKELIDSKVCKEKITVVYNGIDYDVFNPKKGDRNKIRKKLGLEGKFVYSYYGRPGITKGVEFLVSAVPMIAKKVSKSKLMLILSKSPENRYKHIMKMVSEFKDDIVLLDPLRREDLPDYIKASDCVVVPSLTEGFGFTAGEACAMDVPVVATDTTSLPEVVSGRYVLVEPRNPKAIADAVYDVYNGKVSRKSKKLFKWEDNVQGYLKVYKKLLEK